MMIPADDADVDWLISRLSYPLLLPDRDGFRQAAEAALAGVACPGAGINYRIVGALQRDFFIPPDDTSWDITQTNWRDNKLVNGPPIEDNRDLRFTRHPRPTT